MYDEFNTYIHLWHSTRTHRGHWSMAVMRAVVNACIVFVQHACAVLGLRARITGMVYA